MFISGTHIYELETEEFLTIHYIKKPSPNKLFHGVSAMLL